VVTYLYNYNEVFFCVIYYTAMRFSQFFFYYFKYNTTYYADFVQFISAHYKMFKTYHIRTYKLKTIIA